jgi:hypothetical protein
MDVNVLFPLLFAFRARPRMNAFRESRCMRCGYCLRGAVSEFCPECGAPIDPVSCPDCRGRGCLSLLPPRRYCVLGIVLSIGIFAGIWFIRPTGSAQVRLVAFAVFVFLASLLGMFADLFVDTTRRCQACNGSGRANRM